MQPDDVGTYYYEFRPTSIQGGVYPTLYFIQDPKESMTDAPNLYFYLHADGTLISRMATEVSGTAPSFNNNDIVGVLINLQNDSVEIKVNGQPGVVMQLDNREYLNMALSANTNAMGSVNFGQQPFQYAPEDVSGFVSDNLPKPAIINGSQHHRAIVGPGQGYLVYNEGEDSDPDPQRAAILTDLVGSTPTGAFMTSSVIYDMGTEVTSAYPGFQGSAGYWVSAGTPQYQPITTLVSLDGSANSWTQVDEGTYTAAVDTFININTSTPFRYVRMRKNTTNNNLALAGASAGGILEAAQATFPNGLWWIKDRDNDGTKHQILDSMNGNSAVMMPPPTAPQTYVAPTGNSVAWCWSAPDSWTDPSIDTGYRNVKAGFSMFTYTGDGNNTRNLAHGLGKVPECIIIMNNELSGDIYCYIKGLDGTGDETRNLVFSTTEASNNAFGAGIIYAPDSPISFTVGLSQSPNNITAVNESGRTYRCYCWTSVPGYSQFGTYTGNGASPSGNYTHMDFQPDFLITKQTSTTGDWRVYDTTRSPWNPVDSCLRNASDQKEQTGGQAMDWLCTGVRNRDTGSPNNGAGVEYAYMAFAKHPFKYSNAR